MAFQNHRSRTSKSMSIPMNSNSSSASFKKIDQHENEALADLRESLLFHRITHRIASVQQQMHSDHWKRENTKCLIHIINIRNGLIDTDDGGDSSDASSSESNAAEYGEEDIFIMDM